MVLEKEAIIDLLEKKQLYLKEITKIDRILNAIEDCDYIIDKWANDKMTSAQDYNNFGSTQDKIDYVLQKLGEASIDDIVNYLLILGEKIERKSLVKKVKSHIELMYTNGRIQSLIKKRTTLYCASLNKQID